MAKACGDCGGRGSYDDPPWGIVKCGTCRGTGITHMATVDVHSILREAEAAQAARANQLPDHQDCIRMMVQVRLRLMELGWQSAEYAPKDGRHFEAIVAGFAGPSVCAWLGSGFFVADKGDWWPARPFMWRPLSRAAAAIGESDE